MKKPPRKKPGRKASTVNFDALSQAELAKGHGVTARTIVNWDKEGHPRNADGSYRMSLSVEWRINREVHDGLSLDAERAKLTKAQAAKANLDLDARRGELIPTELVQEILQSLSADLASRHDGLAGRTAAEFAAITDPAIMRARNLDELRGIRGAFADAIERVADILDSTADRLEDDAAATKADGRRVGGSESGAASGELGARTMAQ